RGRSRGEGMTRSVVRLVAVLAGAAGCLLVAGPANAGSSGTVGAQTAACLAHVVGGQDPDFYEYYTNSCTGHDEPELDPVSSAPHSAFNVTWHVALPADGTAPVSSVGPTFWFGGTVADSNPEKLGREGFLELQIYPDSLVKRCASNGGFN